MPTLRPVSPPFVHRLRVRYHECDAQGIVFNAHHFAYFDITLTELWREAFGAPQALAGAGSDAGVVDPAASVKSSPRLADLLAMGMTRAPRARPPPAAAISLRAAPALAATG